MSIVLPGKMDFLTEEIVSLEIHFVNTIQEMGQLNTMQQAKYVGLCQIKGAYCCNIGQLPS